MRFYSDTVASRMSGATAAGEAGAHDEHDY